MIRPTVREDTVEIMQLTKATGVFKPLEIEALKEVLEDYFETNQALGHTHVPGPVQYPVTPPVGGDHNATWMNCGVYDKPVPSERAVHNLEHGAVWITYRPSLPQSQVDQLRAFAAKQTPREPSPPPAEPAVSVLEPAAEPAAAPAAAAADVKPENSGAAAPP